MHLVSDPRIGMFFFLVGFQCSIVPLLLDDEHPNLPQKKKKKFVLFFINHSLTWIS